MRRDEGAVVSGGQQARVRRLCPRRAEAVREAVDGFVELVVVRRSATALGRRGDEAECRGSLELLGPENAVVERAEAHPAAAKPETVAERLKRNEVVVAALQLADMFERGVAQLDVARIAHRR